MATRVLLLDDNPLDWLLATRALAAEFPDLEVSELLDEAAFEEALERLDVDVIVSDYRLRWSDGLQVLAAVRAAGYAVPVVMFTQTGSEEIAAAGLRAGLADYVIKAATHYGRLAQAVRTALQNASATRGELDARARESAALRTAEGALRVRDEFLATLSHELRTPLNAISGWVQILKSNREPDRIARGLDALDRNAVALRVVIEDLADASRIVTGRPLTLQIEPTDFRNVLDAAVEALRPAASQKALDVRIAAGAAFEPVAADPGRLQQIVWNLLSNAVKFTPQGGRIDITLQADDSVIELIVANEGPGVHPDFLPRLFDRFAQQDSSTTRANGGLGLGLAIVRDLVKMHGGTVTGTSTPGHGATFTVRIPIAAAAAHGDDQSAVSAPSTRLDGIRVLVVDDDADTREVLGHMMEDEGAVVTVAHSAAAAYEELTSNLPDVLVCDINMPDEDGLTFITRVRAHHQRSISSIPAIAVTVCSRDQDRVRTLEAGFQFHLCKPVSARDLVGTVGLLAHCEEP